MPVRRAYRGRRTAVTMKPAGMSATGRPELGRREREPLGRLPGEVRERPVEGAGELLRQDHVPKAAQGVRVPVDEGGAHRGPDRQLQVGAGVPTTATTQRPTGSRPSPDARLRRAHVQGDPRGEEEGERLVAERDTVDRGDCDQPAIRVRRPGPDRVPPRPAGGGGARREREMEHVRVRERADSPGDRGQGQERAGRDRHQRPGRPWSGTSTAVSPAAMPSRRAESRFIRRAGSPTGASSMFAIHPRRT